MIKIHFIVPALILILSSAASAESNENDAKPYVIESSEFLGFEECKISSALQETMKRLIKSEKPEKKEERAWIYSTKAKVFGLPAKWIMIGVCDASGNRDCGWGSFIAVVIPRPIEEVKKRLKKQFGADLTKEKREEEHNVTLRPVLSKRKSSSVSILFCDPGNL